MNIKWCFGDVIHIRWNVNKHTLFIKGVIVFVWGGGGRGYEEVFN